MKTIFDLDYTLSYMLAHPWSTLAALCWLFVGLSALVAIIAHGYVRDTVMERVALAAVSMGAISRAFYVYDLGVIPADGAWLAIAAAFYCAVLIWKHLYVIPRRPDYIPPEEMPRY